MSMKSFANICSTLFELKNFFLIILLIGCKGYVWYGSNVSKCPYPTKPTNKCRPTMVVNDRFMFGAISINLTYSQYKTLSIGLGSNPIRKRRFEAARSYFLPLVNEIFENQLPRVQSFAQSQSDRFYIMNLLCID